MKKRKRSTAADSSSESDASTAQASQQAPSRPAEDDFQRLYRNMFLADRGPNKRQVKPKRFEEFQDIARASNETSTAAAPIATESKEDDTMQSSSDEEDGAALQTDDEIFSESSSDGGESGRSGNQGNAEIDDVEASSSESDSDEDDSDDGEDSSDSDAMSEVVDDHVPDLDGFKERWRNWVGLVISGWHRSNCSSFLEGTPARVLQRLSGGFCRT